MIHSLVKTVMSFITKVDHRPPLVGVVVVLTSAGVLLVQSDRLCDSKKRFSVNYLRSKQIFIS